MGRISVIIVDICPYFFNKRGLHKQIMLHCQYSSVDNMAMSIYFDDSQKLNDDNSFLHPLVNECRIFIVLTFRP